MTHPSDGTAQRGHLPPAHGWVRVGDHAAPALILDQRRTSEGWEVYCCWAVGGESRTGWVAAEGVRRA